MIMPGYAAGQFVSPEDAIASVEPYGRGIIHDTYLVKLGHGKRQFILQRINQLVFRDPEAIMHNLRVVSDHVENRRRLAGGMVCNDWQMFHIITARDDRDFFIDPDGGFWRALSCIQAASPLEQIAGLNEAREVGRGLGIFHKLVSDLDPGLLKNTLPGFHNIERYLSHYDEAMTVVREVSGSERFCQKFIEERRNWAPVLEKGRRGNALKVRIIHGDPKINNIMLDWETGRAVSMIDLDTVMPGLVHYDIGDCLRSCCNTLQEDAADISAVYFDLERCRAVLSCYTGAARDFLTESDFDFFFDAVRLLPFELGLRFYTDHLKGNVYFKARSPDQNLKRAMVQFRLVESIEKQEEEIRGIVAENRSARYGK